MNAAKQKTGHLALKLTPRQAKFLWAILDGAMDAGACADGLTPTESITGNQIMTKMLPYILAQSKAART